MSNTGFYQIGGLHRPDQVGGFPVALNRLYNIFNQVVSLTRKADPKVIYIGVAAGDPETNEKSLRENLQKTFSQGDYSSTTYFISLHGKTSKDTVNHAFEEADIVYMDGGPNGDKLKQLIKKQGLEEHFKSMIADGKLVGGQSAGAIILGETYPSWIGSEPQMEKGLGLIPELAVTAHIDDKNQRNQRLSMIDNALKNNARINKAWGISSGFALLSNSKNDEPQLIMPEGWKIIESENSDNESEELAAVINTQPIYAAPTRG